MRASSAASRASSSRAASARANASSARSASAGPRQSDSASVERGGISARDECLEPLEVELVRLDAEP